jgi:putative peptide zinc metalloprotease protein
MPTSDRTTERPIGLSRRRDLVIVPQQFGTERYWVVKDPLSMRFVRLREAEFALFEALDGRTSLDDLTALFETRFAPERIKPVEVSRFVGMLHQSGLLVSERPGQGRVLEKRGRERRRKEWRGRWLNPLAVRFRGIDPSRLFDVLLPVVRPLYTRVGFFAWLLFVSSALLLVALRWDTVRSRLPTFHEFLTPTNLLLLACVTGGIKVLHEFGHGLTCRHFGGECRELGVMFLVFTPCLYCEVTDSWRFKNKWHRVAVDAAGIYVELLLAAIAAYVWWFSEPGLLPQICLGVMAVASVGTVVFNGNPLMRYDGYYILSDALEAPNLAERSAAVLRYFFSRTCLGIEDDPPPQVPAQRRGWFAAYAVTSGIYRWLVTFSIILFLVEAARPYRLEFLARLLGLLGVGALVFTPLVRLKQLFAVPGAARRMKTSHVAVSTAVAAAVLGGLLFVPLPHRVFGPLELQTFHPESIYVEVPGRVVEAGHRYGETVSPGTVLARLENHDIELAVEELTARRDRQRTELASLRREQFDNPSAALSIARTAKLLESLEEQLQEKLRDLARLTVTAERGGVLFPPAETPPTVDDENLSEWVGRPLDPANRGCTVRIGSLLGEIGDPHRWQAAVVLDQEDVEFVKLGDDVEVLLDALPEQVLRGRVDEIALGELRETPRRLSNKAGGELATKSDAAAAERPVSTSYLVRVQIDDPEGRLRIGWRGAARIHVAAKPLGVRLARQLSRTFHFNL